MNYASWKLQNLGGTPVEYVAYCNKNLSNADLSGANLRFADLRNVNMSNADLRNADMSGANLYGANLYGAKGIVSVYVPSMSSRGDYLYANTRENGIWCYAGCFTGTPDELRARVRSEKGDTKAARLYLAAIDFIELVLSEGTK